MAWGAIAGAIGGGAASGIVGSIAQGTTNRKNRQFASDMAQRERGWALEDFKMQNEREDMVWNRQNVYDAGLWEQEKSYANDIWNRQNNYDSPEAQMGRFRNAGLNPNLIYGQANTGAQYNFTGPDSHSGGSGTIAHTPGPRSQAIAPKFDFGVGPLTYAQLKNTNAQTDNVKAQASVAVQEAALKGVQTANMAQEGRIRAIDLQSAQRLKDISVDAALADLARVRTSTSVEQQRNEREKIMTASNLAEAAARIDVNLTQKQLNDMELELRRAGTTIHDFAGARLILQMIDKMKNAIPFNPVY